MAFKLCYAFGVIALQNKTNLFLGQLCHRKNTLRQATLALAPTKEGVARCDGARATLVGEVQRTLSTILKAVEILDCL